MPVDGLVAPGVFTMGLKRARPSPRDAILSDPDMVSSILGNFTWRCSDLLYLRTVSEAWRLAVSSHQHWTFADFSSLGSRLTDLRLARLSTSVVTPGWTGALISLDISGCDRLTDLSVQDLMRSSSTAMPVSTLSISRCSGLTDASLFAIAECCPNLTALDAKGLHQITDAGITALVQRCTKLKLLEASGRLISPQVAGLLERGSFRQLCFKPAPLKRAQLYSVIRALNNGST